VDWLANGTTEEEFARFSDAAALAESLRWPGQDSLCLYQDGHQRLADEHRRPARRTFFRVCAFAVEPALYRTPQKLLASMWPRPMALMRNAYRFELPSVFPDSTTFPIGGVVPLVGVSLNRFRGRNDLSLACPLANIIADLGLTRDAGDALTFRKGASVITEFTEWMDPYDQGRRRQQPAGAGVLLTTRRSTLEEWLTAGGRKLAWFGEAHRSTDQYKPESEMHWTTCRWVACDGTATQVLRSTYDGVDFQDAGDKASSR
jgi:hypothetical protein